MEPWNATWRTRALPELAARDWDLLVIGGGICGAGILREAARRGWRCLLLEQRDFAWGTSSRSSKMVHGGLRYVAKGQLGLTRDSVRERQRLLGEAPGLVEPLSFVMPHYRGGFPGPKVFGGLLSLYDALAGKRNHLFYPLQQLRYLAPGIREDGLLGGTRFFDAVTDDARLVQRVLGEARAEGGEALNGMRVVELLREAGRVVGVLAEDIEPRQPAPGPIACASRALVASARCAAATCCCRAGACRWRMPSALCTRPMGARYSSSPGRARR